MDVAHGAIDTDRRHVEDRQTAGDVDPPPGSPDDIGIIGTVHRHVDPGIEVQAVFDDRIGATELQHHGGSDLGFMCVLSPAGEGVDVDEISTHGFSQRLQIRDRRHHTELVGGLHDVSAAEGGGEHEEQREDSADHFVLRF